MGKFDASATPPSVLLLTQYREANPRWHPFVKIDITITVSDNTVRRRQANDPIRQRTHYGIPRGQNSLHESRPRQMAGLRDPHYIDLRVVAILEMGRVVASRSISKMDAIIYPSPLDRNQSMGHCLRRSCSLFRCAHYRLLKSRHCGDIITRKPASQACPKWNEQ